MDDTSKLKDKERIYILIKTSLELFGPNQYISFFKHGNSFDISQTSEYENYLQEQEKIDEVIMKNAEIDYETALDFVKSNFPEVKITEDFKQQEKRVHIYQPSST